MISFIGFLLLFAAIGTLSIKRKRSAVDDYLLASRSVHPWLTGLSSVVTNNSGYMFIGLIGFTYSEGFSAIWVTVGWIAGDLVAWFFVHPRLRAVSETSSTSTVGALMAEPYGKGAKMVAGLAGIISILFLASYAAAQLNAGSKALHVMFDWNIEVGALIGAGIVLLYSYAGGLRASIWTDAAQAVVMMGAMVALAVMGLNEVGGLEALFTGLKEIDSRLVDPIPEDLKFGFLLFLAGWLFAGFGAVGQPHILIRTMALSETRLIRTARRVYFGWYFPFATAAVLVALCARVIMPEVDSFDPELALPQLAQRFGWFGAGRYFCRHNFHSRFTAPDLLCGLHAGSYPKCRTVLLEGKAGNCSDDPSGAGHRFRRALQRFPASYSFLVGVGRRSWAFDASPSIPQAAPGRRRCRNDACWLRRFNLLGLRFGLDYGPLRVAASYAGRGGRLWALVSLALIWSGEGHYRKAECIRNQGDVRANPLRSGIRSGLAPLLPATT